MTICFKSLASTGSQMPVSLREDWSKRCVRSSTSHSCVPGTASQAESPHRMCTTGSIREILSLSILRLFSCNFNVSCFFSGWCYASIDRIYFLKCLCYQLVKRDELTWIVWSMNVLQKSRKLQLKFIYFFCIIT